jgi:DNA polymerase-3 subunit delta'
MGFGRLVGQERAVRVLRSAIARDRVAHSYLFTGPESVGKSTAAMLFAQALNCQASVAGEASVACEAEPEDAPCGRCRSCTLIERGNHPDVRLLKPDLAKRKSVITIDALRQQFVYDVQLRPVMGRYKVYLLDHVERTAPMAVHTILKTLEEPPPYVVTVVVTDNPDELPSTIPSRCQKVAFQLVGTHAIEAKLRELELDAHTAAAIARLSGGRIAWAIRAAQRPEVLAARRELLDLCTHMVGSGLPSALRLAEDIKVQAAKLVQAQVAPADESEGEEAGEPTGATFGSERRLRAELPWCLDVIVSWYRDLLTVGQQIPLLNPDYEAVMRERSRPEMFHQAECAIESILETKHAIERNANIDVALESLVIGLVGWCD